MTNARRLSELDAAHLIRGFMRLSDRAVLEPLVITEGKGVWVFDERGTPYLEAAAGMWCAAFGFGEEELIEAATAQLRRLPYYHTLTNKTVGPAVELAEKLASMVPVPGAKVHLVTSGSEANDFLVKFVRYANNARGDTGRKTFISRVNGYHGATLGAASLTGIPRMHQAFDLPLPGFLHTADPHFYRAGRRGETAAEFTTRMADELETVIRQAGPETIAGFVAEPFTGGGGVVVPPDGYYAKVQQVLARYGIPFFADEVVTGFCRTGNWFGSQTAGISPAGMTLGKALSGAYQPIGAVVVSGDIYEAMERGSDQVGTFAHGATHSGHPVTSAVSLRAVQLMEERDLLGHVRSVMPRFEARLRSFADHPLVGDIRAAGLMGAIELVADRTSRQLFDPVGSASSVVGAAAQRHGLIVRTAPAGDTIAFSPPLVITEAEIDEVFDRFGAALAEVEGQLTKAS